MIWSAVRMGFRRGFSPVGRCASLAERGRQWLCSARRDFRFGPAGCSSTRRSSGAFSSQGRESETRLGLRSVSSRPDDMPPEVRFGSVSDGCCGFSSSFFKGEGPRLQEGRKGGRKCAEHDGGCSSLEQLALAIVANKLQFPACICMWRGHEGTWEFGKVEYFKQSIKIRYYNY